MTVRENGMFVPERFRNILSLHIVKNVLAGPDFRTPLLLGIHGPPGEGKTLQCEAALADMGVHVNRILARDFESSNAGEPGQLLIRKYRETSMLISAGDVKYAVLFINDLDTGIGHWGNDVQYTVNTQIVVGTMMSIADYPEYVGEHLTLRVPIIVTGNDFTKLYAPLTREGRMRLYTWIPTVEEKINIIRHSIFPLGTLTQVEIEDLVRRYSSFPIAFFSLLRTVLQDEALLERMRDIPPAKIISEAFRFREDLILPQIEYSQVLDRANELISNKVTNHLATYPLYDGVSSAGSEQNLDSTSDESTTLGAQQNGEN